MKKIMIILLLGILVLAGCMQKSDETTASETEETESQSIMIEDGFGQQTFDEVPKRVVALEWSIVEELLALGIQPVGVADIENFNKWVTIDAQLDDSVTEVGLRTEPNIEEIANLNPDVIIGKKGHQGDFKEELEKVAPVVMYDSTSQEAQEDLYAHMIDTLQKTATLVGKEQKAEDRITHLKESMQEAKENIEAANLPMTDFVFTQAYSVNQTPTFRLFTPNSLVSQVLEGVGLTNKIQDQGVQSSGFVESNVETVSNYEEALFLHTVQKDDPLFDNLAGNEAWNSLYFVQEGAMYDVGAGIWTFGSVLSMETMIDHVEEALVK
ncbi:iron complex transport system substrate-binding protein [Gracilibacillus orientalis]|uniref:Iron complex transport system substrate-binding protein n=1 Tax=Gracilibacillus orientalis TaxID=334253 RepID=A0A1I4LX72_9BACI|nr:iron-siderophore ABC transporter substrate-binding protein [Gracilibacillus orientalis]SFL95396.1 iron complex transport system substrate-binding protein [Gracilibacillus orientalis]